MIDYYIEFSPSGSGIRIIAFRKLPGKRNRKGGVEMYDRRGRFLTVTGHRMPGTREDIEDRATPILQMYRQTWQEDPPPAKKPTQGRVGGSVASISDNDLLEKMFAASNGNRIRALYNGDTSAYGGNDSEADAAFCCHLAFWTQRDETRMDSIFRTSGLMRDKWDEARGEATYRQITLKSAINICKEVYTEKRAGKPAGNSQTGDEAG